MYKIPCKKCKGHGTIVSYKHVESGICFECSGSGHNVVNEIEYNEHLQSLELKEKGNYILFNNGNIEYFKTEKEIIKKYGNFYSDNNKTSYKDKNIKYTTLTNNYNAFIKKCREEMKQSDINDLKKKINTLEKEINNTNDQLFKTLLTSKINELYIELAAIQNNG